MEIAQPLHLSVLMPLRDDWGCAGELVARLDSALAGSNCRLSVVLVDDASPTACEPDLFRRPFAAVRCVRTLRLRRNLGHQRAIAIGLAYLAHEGCGDGVVVMDADGEDTPEGVAALIEAFRWRDGEAAIFAERSRRSESIRFRFFYRLYKLLHRMLTGYGVRVGNFSILPAAHLGTLLVTTELWNHYAAAVFRSRLPLATVPIARGPRIYGTSSMNFVGLVTHGLSAVSVYGDIVGVRLLLASLTGVVLTLIATAAVVFVRLFTTQAIPGWATYATGTLIVITMQLLSIAASFTFFILSTRNTLGFMPARDYSLFIGADTVIYPHD